MWAERKAANALLVKKIKEKFGILEICQYCAVKRGNQILELANPKAIRGERAKRNLLPDLAVFKFFVVWGMKGK